MPLDTQNAPPPSGGDCEGGGSVSVIRAMAKAAMSVLCCIAFAVVGAVYGLIAPWNGDLDS
jgi:hypothetical protein